MPPSNTGTTPVVLVTFNRPDKLHRVLEAIRQARPERLLVVSDGPRKSHPEDAGLVQRCRRLVAGIDWRCDVQTNYSDVNLGCRDRVASGLSWAFTKTDRAIILEDDCVPTPLFFEYCTYLLERYREDRRIGALCGTNPAIRAPGSTLDYFPSRHFLAWGWATWADRWNCSYDVSLAGLYRPASLTRLFRVHGVGGLYWLYILWRVRRRRIDTWDHQWAYANWQADRVCLVPTQNLVKNIGFDAEGTHTLAEHGGHLLANLAVCDLDGYDPFRMQRVTWPGFDRWFTKLFIGMSLSSLASRLGWTRRAGGRKTP